MNHWLHFLCRGRARGFPLRIRCQRWGQRHKVTPCAVPGLGHGGKEPTCLSPQGLLSQHPIVALALKDVTAFGMLLMASHGNQEPCDFHPPHPGARNRKWFFCVLPRLAQLLVYQGEHGLWWEKLLVLGRVFLPGESCESAELQTSVRAVRASSWLPDTQLLAGVTAGDTLCWCLGRGTELFVHGAVARTWCLMAAQWGFRKWKGR